MIRSARLRCALLALLVCVAACDRPERTVRFGLISVHGVLHSPASGVPAFQGATLAVDQLNRAGGITLRGVRHRVVLIERQVEAREEAGAIAARELINLDSVDVIIGPDLSVAALGAAPVAEASGVVMLAPMASSPGITAGRKYVLRLALLDRAQGQILARFAYDSLGVRRVGAVHDAASPYARSIAQLFDTAFRAVGGRFVGTETFDADGSHDHRVELRRLLAKRPDAILLPTLTAHDSALVRQARALGFRGPFLGSDSWGLQDLQNRHEVHGSVLVANWDRRDTRPALQRFDTLWNVAYPDVVSRAAALASYDAIRLLAVAMTRADTSQGLVLADSLRHFGVYEGAIATFNFHGTNDPRRGAVLVEVVPEGFALRAYIAPPSP